MTDSNSIVENKRDHGFDTLKGLLIFLVVLGHLLDIKKSSMQSVEYLYSLIYSFHMPAFAFVSGYFSKSSKSFKMQSYKAVKTILIPFVICHIIMWAFASRSLPELFTPRWSSWYLLCLFVWKILIVPVTHIRFSMITSIILALLIGFSPADQMLALSRLFSFFPFFLLGYKSTESQIQGYRSNKKTYLVILLILVSVLVVSLKYFGLPIAEISKMAHPYNTLEITSNFNGMLYRMLAMIIGVVWTICLICLVPQKQSILSKLGRTTMTVYLVHPFLVRLSEILINKAVPMLLSNELFILMFSFGFSILICVAFGNVWVNTLYNKIIDRIASILMIDSKK